MTEDQSTASVKSIHDARRDMYRHQIASAAEIEFAKAGFDSTPMSAIAATAGLSLATVYKTFSGKAEIWDTLHAERMQALLAYVQAEPGPTALDSLLNGVARVALFLIENPSYLELNLRVGGGWTTSADDGHGLQRSVWGAGLGQIASGVEAAIAAGDLTGIRPAVAAGLVVSALQVWLSDWASSDRTGDREALVADMIARLRLALVGPTA